MASINSPLQAVLEYYQVFSTLDLAAIVSWFNEPCLSIGPMGVFSAGNRAGLANALAPFIESLKAKGYDHSEFADPEVTMLTEKTALVRGVAVRFAADGAELERVPISYLLHQGEASWKIAVMVLPS